MRFISTVNRENLQVLCLKILIVIKNFWVKSQGGRVRQQYSLKREHKLTHILLSRPA